MLQTPPSIYAIDFGTSNSLLAAANAQTELTRQLAALPPDKRDAEAPRIANNVVLEFNAREAQEISGYTGNARG